MLKEFKKFIMRGNVVDLAVGVIIGASFNKIVTSLVGDVISPILALFIGRIDFSDLVFFEMRLGSFFMTIVDFLITGTAIFLIVKAINKLNEKVSGKKEKTPEPVTKECPYCFTNIAIKAVRCPNCTSDLNSN